MDNATTLTFRMTAYAVMENYKHLLFVVFLLLYLLIITLNSVLITVIHQNKVLHQPMNVFTCVLSVNEMYGSTALLPAVMAVLLSDTHEVSVKWCLAQVYFLHSYACAEFFILAVMGYDRYIAICYPLHYHSIMSNSKLVNGLYGSTALLPALLSNLLSHSYEISLPLCQTQIFAVHTYAITEFTILAAMSYDRYVAICYPLLYHTIMSQRVVKLIVFTWLYPFLAFLIVLAFTVQLRFCERTIEKVYCMNYLLVKLACTDTSIVNIVGLLSVVVYTIPQLVMIFYSYVHILRICVVSFSKSKLKALRTCTPHLLSIVNYSIGCFLEIAQSRFNIRNLPYQTKLFLSVYFLIFPPILNPAIYGLSIQHIRVRLFRLFSKKSRQELK
ncbi:olfactory receptor 52D1-like [Xyrichtys novacula]|uniref:Olfactory receptor n=1 Tax=Xyrichtys novacula TaxID=13765 RepID=A0AAV1FSG3_XYRNO|nr:olfactory receptor 52D1-like [Xyrichtys novacula]